VDPFVIQPGEGETVAMGESQIQIKLNSGNTDGALYLGETTIAPGFEGPAPHIHERMHDIFYVLEGTLTLHLADGEVDAGPGALACVPPGNRHTFSNRTEAQVRLLNLFSPAGLEGYFSELAEAIAAGREPGPELMAELASRYDFKRA
jgi:mannose-6-phosphate isomerase-like protein (cupin superfamily)